MELTCVVRDAKPKATIVWYRRNTEFYTGTFVCLSVCQQSGNRKQNERTNEGTNERASITDSAGVPNDLPSLPPFRLPATHARAQQQLPEAKNNSPKVTVQIAFLSRRICFRVKSAATGNGKPEEWGEGSGAGAAYFCTKEATGRQATSVWFSRPLTDAGSPPSCSLSSQPSSPWPAAAFHIYGLAG